MSLVQRQTNQRYILWMLLASYVILLGGIPGITPTQKTGAARSDERFPCENCPCGCSTAEFCWDQCCCHDDAGKIAWAEANGVTPPEFLTARVAKSNTVVACSTKPVGSPARKCCCCSAKPIEPAKPKKVDQLATTSVVLFWKAAQCRGVQSFWKLISITVVGNRPKNVVTPAILLASLVIADESAESPVYAPVPPVPWASLL